MTPMEGVQGAMEHLLFHKAIIHEEDRARRLDRYMEVLEGGEEQLASRDEADRSFEVVFELVLRNDLDPWDIDLMQFSRLYAARMREREVDFIVAGKLLFMAWTILRRQSEVVLSVQEREDGDELFCLDWDMDSMDLFLDDEEGFDPADLEPCRVELREVVRHKERRPVMLVELLDAFDEARRESKARLERVISRESREEVFDEKSHTEELERDVDEVLGRISRCGGGPITIMDICDGTREDLIKVFLSILFLTRMGKISLWQDDLPHGKIFLEVKIPWDIGTLEDVPESKAEMVEEKGAM
jgi:segregation and condensation protein A